MSNEMKGSGHGEDGELQRRLDRLADAVRGLAAGEEQRRERLIERAESRGLGRAEAEQAYDVAADVGLEPAYGLAVVAEGISVQILDGPSADVQAVEAAEPEWVDTPPGPGQAARERRLRQTFRRLRSKLEEEPTLEGAFRAFAREPDLEVHRY